jgi:uncharacterized damage-inducible protein DinB
MSRMRWFDRKFDLGLPASGFPPILGRLRSFPDRLEREVQRVPDERLRLRIEGAWSIQENVGHLLDLEALWEQRLDDYDAGVTLLHPADLENRKTHDANHNASRIEDLLRDFRAARLRIVQRLERMSAAELSRVALHPRLQQPMSVVDLGFFVAEHDEHHLNTITTLAT